MKLLLIEDDVAIADVVRRGLERSGFQVEVAADGAEGLRLALSEEHSLILLDVMLPIRDGWSICRELRARRRTVPILMLTARDDVDDRVRGLDLGADDYLPKPFAFPELLARVRSLLRRDKIHRARVIRIDDLEIDTDARRVTRGQSEIHLTPREYALLEALASQEGRVLSRSYILERVWDDEESVSNTVDVHVATLRKKIDAGREDRLIQTVHGAGYALRRREDE